MRRSIRRLVRRALRSSVTLHGSPEAIALGTAVAVFVAFTPTIGFQMLLAALIATLLGANRPAAVVPPWITNPVTIPAIFALTYWVGRLFLPGPPVAEVYQRLLDVVKSLGELSFYALYDRLRELLAVGAGVFVPMMIGGVIIGAICAGISYPLMLWAVRRYRRRRERRRQLRALRGSQSQDPPVGSGLD